MKAAYRQQVEQLYRGGANTIGKQHFTLLYRCAREVAFTPRNIRSGWSKAGIFPFNPERVLRDMTKPISAQLALPFSASVQQLPPPNAVVPRTPTTSASLNVLRSKFESSVDVFDESSKLLFHKIANAAEKAFADRAILFDENKNLTEQNNEKIVRDSKTDGCWQGEDYELQRHCRSEEEAGREGGWADSNFPFDFVRREADADERDRQRGT